METAGWEIQGHGELVLRLGLKLFERGGIGAGLDFSLGQVEPQQAQPAIPAIVPLLVIGQHFHHPRPDVIRGHLVIADGSLVVPAEDEEDLRVVANQLVPDLLGGVAPLGNVLVVPVRAGGPIEIAVSSDDRGARGVGAEHFLGPGDRKIGLPAQEM